ncbi:MAG: hypothetical protein ACLQVI_18990 [Polyangiaceae bacterium]
MRRGLFAVIAALAVLLAGRQARAQVCDTEDAGPCAFNAYCALPDAGAILDGAPGVCLPEPCVVSTDCTNPTYPICDTSQNPFQCVECISGADCPGVLVCDVTNHTCVNPPPIPDASDDTGAPDGEADASEDATTPVDASPLVDAADSSPPAVDANDGGLENGVAPPDEGSAGGGAWDCELATPARAPFAAAGVSLAFVLLFMARKGRRRRPGS